MIANLRRKLPPDLTAGQAAQLTMAPPVRKIYAEAPPGARQAAVMVLLHAQKDDLEVLFIERSRHPNDRHSGQISFPGGRVEPADEDLEATARREMEEEIGISADAVDVLGPLTPLYIPVSNFMMHPFVGYLRELPQLTLQTSEVARTLVIPVSAFLAADVRVVADRKLSSGMRLKEVPFWNVGGVEIWGATSMVMAELINLIKKR